MSKYFSKNTVPEYAENIKMPKTKSNCEFNNKDSYMEDEFGIKDTQQYLINYITINKMDSTIIGKILNFDANQFTIKSKKGLYVIMRKNVIELRPVEKREV